MGRVQIFWLLLTATVLIALILGGRPERLAAIALAIAALATRAAYLASLHPWAKIDPGMLGIDTLLAAGLLAIALTSERYWPLWMTALQCAAVLCHFTRLIPNLFGMAYAIALQLWCYPIMLLLMVASVRYRLRTKPSG